jgi:capsular exopolysaccharide synthesis family protein
MTESSKVNLENYSEVAEQEEQSSFSFQSIFAMLVLNWQWFLLSLFICLCAALLYLRYVEPVYEMSARILIKDDNSRARSRSSSMLANMQDFGIVSNSAGIQNEIEILESKILAREAVKDLKLYVEYRSVGRITKPLVYDKQPVSVDLDPTHLAQMDSYLLEGAKTIRLNLRRKDGNYVITGETLLNGKPQSRIERKFNTLPSAVNTKFGVLTFTKHGNSPMEDDAEYIITIAPPMLVATRYVNSMSVEPTSKLTSIAELTLRNNNPKRGIDFLKQLAICYNRQANADKNEIALKTEEFINGRLAKIDSELGSTEDALESYKRRNSVTQLNMDASQSLQMSTQYATKLSEANAQIQLLDYLREFVDNQYKIIPSNVGMSDHASISLIASYNQTVQDRNRFLKAASEHAPQVQTLTATLDELQSSIRQALLQARRTADIQRQSVQSEYSKYQSRVNSTPEQERILTQIGRQQEVKSGLYLMLLQKREENSISLAATADKGKLIDEPSSRGKVSPKKAIILLAAAVLGIGIPFLILYLLQLLSYKIEGHDDVVRLTRIPVIADVAVASESAKTAAGIVVHENKNEQIDEIFRAMRTNIQFMLQGDQKVILFTSSSSGEGKTFNAANIAVSFALLGKKTILCGLDIRKPALGRLFDIKDRQRGITTLLTKNHITESELQEQISASGVNPNLDLLLAGPTPPNPTELLARETFSEIIDLLRKEYDYIIFDTAPVGLVTDTLQIGRNADVTVFVCRADYTPKSSFGVINSIVDEKKLPNPCIVLNGVDMSKKKYGYYYGYGKYGKYARYGYNHYGYSQYGYGNYGQYGNYADSHYGRKDDNSIKK